MSGYPDHIKITDQRKRNWFQGMRYCILWFTFNAVFPGILFSQCIDTIDFTTWAESNGSGHWKVNSPLQVVQDQEIVPPSPTFFVSDQDYINIRFSFDMRSTYAGDDDFIGFVMGYKNPANSVSDDYNMILFDWKRGAGTLYNYPANEGLSLSAIHGTIPDLLLPIYFWWHNEDHANNIYEPLENSYGDGKGWSSGVTYHFEVSYLSTGIRIWRDSTLIIDIDRCNSPGKIGFYTYSQYSVFFSNVTFRSTADLYVSHRVLCVGDTVIAGIDNPLCPGSYPALDSWYWSWGDGQSALNQISSAHVYPKPGEYTLELIVNFPGECSDTILRKILVQAPPVIDLGHDTTIYINSDITLYAGQIQGQWSYLWTTGSDEKQVTLSDLTQDTTVGVWVSNGICEAYDEIYIHTVKPPLPPEFNIWIPNAFSPDDNGLNDIFKPMFRNSIPQNYAFYIYNRWGSELFSTRQPDIGWDGTYKGKICPGDIYVYLIKYQLAGQPPATGLQVKKGNFLLIR